MRRRAHFAMGDDVRLWSAAVATLAILLQTLLAGFSSDPRAMAATHPAAISHPAGHDTGDQGSIHHGMADCTLCVVCCINTAAIELPPAPGLPSYLDAPAIAARRVRAVRRRPAFTGLPGARGPPRLA